MCPSLPFRVSFEVMPPRHPDAAPRFWATIRRLEGAHPDFVSVTYGAGGRDRTTSHQVVSRLIGEGRVRPVAHLTCVGSRRADVADLVASYLRVGVRDFLALRGDPPAGQGPWRPTPGGVDSSIDMVGLMRAIGDRELGDGRSMRIGVAAFPAGNPAAGTTPLQEAERLLAKQRAGADFAITQVFFEAGVFARFERLARSLGVTVPILPGILPPTDPRRLARLYELSAVQAPPALLGDLDRQPDEASRYRVGVAYGAELVRALVAAGAGAIHLYTFNRADPSLDLLREVSGVGAQQTIGTPGPLRVGAAEERPRSHA